MPFVKKFSEDPLRNRAYLLIHSEPKVGKTHMVLDLIKNHGDYVVMFSFDEGTFEVRQEPEQYEGKLMIAKPTTLRMLRDDMHEGAIAVERLVKAGIPRWRIWAVVDTITHMQNRLMTEARMINVKNPDARDVRRDFVRDAVTEVDFNINLVHMSEVANYVSSLPCNVVVNALSREEYVERKKTGRVLPAITGQSSNRFTGDADAILYLNRDDEGNRWMECTSETGGDRSGMLNRKEPADLHALVRKMLGRSVTTEKPAAAPAAAPAAPAAETAAAPKRTRTKAAEAKEPEAKTEALALPATTTNEEAPATTAEASSSST